MRAPPISSSVVISPTTISAIRGEPRYIEALPSTMNTMSQNDGMYAPPAADGPNRQHTCGHLPRQAHLVVEDPPGTAPAREQLDLVGQPGAGRVDQPHDRDLLGERRLGRPHHLLDRAGAPRPGLHHRVVGDDDRRHPVDRAAPGDHAVGGQPGRPWSLASTASSTKEPASSSRSMRSRAVSLPWPRIFSSARSSGVSGSLRWPRGSARASGPR